MYEIKRKLMWSTLKAGIVITAGLVLFFFTIFYSGNISGVFFPKKPLLVEFRNISGLRPGAPVWLYGIEVGKVESIQLVDSGTIIKADILSKYFHIIRLDAKVHIMTMGLLGDKYLEIYPGDPDAPPLLPGGKIEGKESIGFEQIMESFSSSLVQIEHLTRSIDKIVTDFQSSEGTVGKLMNDPELYNSMLSATTELTSLLDQIQNSKGSFSKMMNDPTLYNNLTSATKKFDNIVTKIDSGDGLAASMVGDPKMAADVNEVMRTLKETSEMFSKTAQSMDSLLTDVKSNPKKYFDFSIF